MNDDWRTAIDIPPVMHSNPIPMASRVGNLLFSSGISGRDQATGKAAETIEEQCGWCFKNLARVLDLGGATYRRRGPRPGLDAQSGDPPNLQQVLGGGFP